MAANGYVVNTDVTSGVTWDGVANTRFARGTVLDSPASGALVTALGANITALTSAQQQAMNGNSLGLPSLENRTGGGNCPYNAGQC